MTSIERLIKVYEFIKEKTGQPGSYSYLDFYREKLKINLTRVKDKDSARQMWRRDIIDLDDMGIKTVKRSGMRGYDLMEVDNNINAIRALEFAYQFELQKKSHPYNQFVRFEKRTMKGMNCFTDFLEAIKEKDLTEFRYENYLRATVDKIEFYPYSLAQSKSRWYAVGVKKGGGEIFAFCLDRISNFKVIENQKQEGVLANFNIDEYYKDCMGVYNRPNIKVQTIKFETNKFQAKYIEAFPIHSSQKITESKNGGMVIELKMKITPEVILELAQYGHKIKIIAPNALKKYFIDLHNAAVEVIEDKSEKHLSQEEFLC